METARVLIVEDEPLLRQLLASKLDAEPGIEVVGEASTGLDAVRLAKELIPSAVLMDIGLSGDMDGIEAAILIKEERPETGVVILSAHDDRRYVTRLPLEKWPGWAYLLKQTTPDVATIAGAIEASMNGMVMLDPGVVVSLRPKPTSAVSRLTQRQLDVIRLIAQGFNNAAIAERLVLAEKSIETYINAIYQELELSGEAGVHARVRAALMFWEESQVQR